MARTLTILVASTGCGASDGLDRRAVSGEVTLDGQPLAEGSILFEPASDGPGTAVGARIGRGRYAIPRREGPVPGTYKVRIYASSGVQAARPPGASDRAPRPMVELIPAKYNVRTTLEAIVRSDGQDPFNFSLVSAGRPPEAR